MRKIISMLVCFAILFAFVPQFVGAKSFSDVKSSDWFYEDVSELSDLDIIKGRDGGWFDPQANVTRAEYVAMHNRAFPVLEPRNSSSPAADFFDDIDYWKDWFYSDVDTAALNGVINGRGHRIFDPNAPITRQEAAVVTYNYLKKAEFDFAAAKVGLTRNNVLVMLSDIYSVADWAAEAVVYLFYDDIIDGYDDQTFRPLRNITRAETAAIVNRGFKARIQEILPESTRGSDQEKLEEVFYKGYLKVDDEFIFFDIDGDGTKEIITWGKTGGLVMVNTYTIWDVVNGQVKNAMLPNSNGQDYQLFSNGIVYGIGTGGDMFEGELVLTHRETYWRYNPQTVNFELIAGRQIILRDVPHGEFPIADNIIDGTEYTPLIIEWGKKLLEEGELPVIYFVRDEGKEMDYFDAFMKTPLGTLVDAEEYNAFVLALGVSGAQEVGGIHNKR